MKFWSSSYTDFHFWGVLLLWSYSNAVVPWFGINFLLFILLPQGSYLVYNDPSDVCSCLPYVVSLFFASFALVPILWSLIKQVAFFVFSTKV